MDYGDIWTVGPYREIGSPDSGGHMPSWHGGSGVCPKHSSRCLSASSSHLCIHSATKKTKGGRYSEFTVGPFDGFLLLLDLQPAESDFLAERCLRGELPNLSLVLN